MKETKTPRDQEEKPPTHEAKETAKPLEPKETAKPLEPKADEQEGGGANNAPVRVGG